jgi:hypothetical protein
MGTKAAPTGPSVLYFGNFPGHSTPQIGGGHHNTQSSKGHNTKPKVTTPKHIPTASKWPEPDLRLFTDPSAGSGRHGVTAREDSVAGRDVELGRTGSRAIEDVTFVVESPRKFPPHVTGNFLQHRGTFSGSGGQQAPDAGDRGSRGSSTGTPYLTASGSGRTASVGPGEYFQGRLPQMGAGMKALLCDLLF